MKRACHPLILLGLLIVVSINQQTSAEKTTVVEGNHFYSNYQINTTYSINQVNKDRPIIYVLRKKEDSQVFDNNITITLTSGDKSTECKFTSFNGMCFLDGLPSADMTMKLRCDHLPCEASWTIMQPSSKKLQKTQNIEEMYEVAESGNHMVAMVSCNNPEVKNFQNMVKVYSESEFIYGSSGTIVYLLFKKAKPGHLYFDIEPEAKACAVMNIYKVKPELTEDQQVKDFIPSGESNIYKLSKRPQKQFRVDISFHEMTNSAIQSDLIVTLTGEKGGSRQTIESVTVKTPIPITNYEFSWAIPAVRSEYSNLQIEMKSSKMALVVNFVLSLSERIEIQTSQHSHFAMAKGDVLKFKLISEPNADSSERIMFYLREPTKAKLSTRECSRKQGCEFDMEALDDVQQVLYAGKAGTVASEGEIIYTDFKDSITKKIRESETIYLRTPLKKDQVEQVVVNNPNVIIRAASAEACTVPSEQCYEHIANSHHHFIYEPKKDSSLLFSVTGLDNCYFTLSLIHEGTESVQLKDGTPFIYLMDDREKQIYFKFKLPENIGVSFNLIAPMNDLLLVVNNGKEKPNADEHTASTDGYISFSKAELDSSQFRIMVSKTPEAKHKFVHFTLIASTSGANIRLDPGISHIETIKPKQYKDFVFEFDKKGDYIINFYVPPNVNRQDLNLKLLVSNEDKWVDSKVKHLQITENSDVLNLKDVSEELCIESGDIQCEIFVRLVNSMKIEIDVTVTLLVKDSVIELKDGIWQTYAINTIAQSSNFYFLPKTKNSSINIMYKSTLLDVGISYSVWKSDKEDINPTKWPFPTFKQNVDSPFNLFKSVNHILIDSENLKSCWPSCVILMSLYKKKNLVNLLGAMVDPNNAGSFSLMAANKIFEIPEKTKMQVMLKSGEEKYLMIDLKYSLHKEALTFFTNEIVGSYNLFASVYTEKNPRCPNDEEHDFGFGEVETQIKMASVQAKMKELDMSDDQDAFLCLLATSYEQSKFSIEFTSDEQIIKLLHFDTFEKVEIQPRTPKMYQMEAQQKYEVKITREKGYFYVKIAVCNSQKDYEQCLEQVQSGKDKGKQIITKTQQFSEAPCAKCIVFIRVQSDDYAEAVFHVQSEYSSIELKEKDMIFDFTNEGETNKYSITSVMKQECIINIEVAEGNPVVKVNDLRELNITKEKNPNTNNILIVIPPAKSAENTLLPLGGMNLDSYTYSSTWRYITIEISSKDPKKAISYTISYSSGERETYLEDGMAAGYTLQPDKKTIFLYKNPSEAEHGYLSISMPKSSTLYNLNFKMFTFADPDDQDTKTEVTPEKPPMRKHTPNPTIVYSLPKAKLVSMELTSQEQAKASLLVNHQELIILPFDQEFPFEMHKGESISLLTDVSNPGYVVISVRKCDGSEPDFGYTLDYNQFQKGEFEYSTTLAQEPRYKFYVKAKKAGTLYMQMNSTQDGLYAVQVHYSDSKIAQDKYKVPNNGIIEYKVVDSGKAEVSFTVVTCSGSGCSKSITYYWMASSTLQQVYTQTVCPYSYFQTLGLTSTAPLAVHQITQKPNSYGLVTFAYPFTNHTTYLSIKAVINSDEVYYQPIEVITLWGSINRAGRSNSWVLVVAGLLVCVCGFMAIRRKTKRSAPISTAGGYGKLQEGEEAFDY